MSNKTKTFIALSLVLTLTFTATAQRGSQVGGYGYREAAGTVIKRLQLKPDSVIVDIGAGDGWWASKMAEKLGPDGIIHACEIDQKKVDSLKNKWSKVPQIKPRLIPLDGTALEANTCDLAFISKTYHHFNKDGQIDYLKHLKEVIKPAGKLVIIERHSGLATGSGNDHAGSPGLITRQAEDAGWMLLSCSLIGNSDHFTAIFVQPETFLKRFEERRNKANTKTTSEAPALKPVPVETPALPVPVQTEIPRFGSNSPFNKEFESPMPKKEKQLWARSVLFEEAPEFVVEKWLTDEPEMEGKYKLIEFWATWCPPCRKSMEKLNRFHEKFGDDLVVIGISHESEEDVRKLNTELVKYEDLKFHLAIDTKARMKTELMVSGIPHVIIVEPGGFVVWEGFPLQEGYELTDDIVRKILEVGKKQKTDTASL